MHVLSYLEVIHPLELDDTGANVIAAMQQFFYTFYRLSIQAKNMPDTLWQSDLIAHDSGQVLQKLVESSKLFTAHSNGRTLEKLVTVDEKTHFFGLLLDRGIN